MQQQRTRTTSGSQVLYVGIDVHSKSWRVSILSATRDLKSFSQEPSSAILVRTIDRHFPNAQCTFAYEAGFSGFRLARELRAYGHTCLVVNPADIPTTHKDKMTKTDKVDAHRLARELRSGSLRSVYIPAVVAVEDRALMRQRRKLVGKLSRCKTQIRMQLYNLGQDIPAHVNSRNWPHRLIEWLEGLHLATPSGTATLQSLLRELSFLRAEHLQVTRQIRQLAGSQQYARQVQLLVTVPGVGVVTAMTLLTELVDIDRFPSTDALASFAGLVPRVHASGERISTPEMTSRRNSSLRHVLIEAAWAASKKDPALLEIYEKAAGRMVKSKAIVLVARRLLNRIRAVLLTGTPYTPGMRGLVEPKSRERRPLKVRRKARCA